MDRSLPFRLRCGIRVWRLLFFYGATVVGTTVLGGVVGVGSRTVVILLRLCGIGAMRVPTTMVVPFSASWAMMVTSSA